MKATLTIEVPDDFKKGDGRCDNAYTTLGGKWLCTFGDQLECNADNCPLEIQDEKPVCNDCVLYDNCGYYRKDGECLRSFRRIIMNKDKAYEMLDGAITEMTDDFWDTSTDKETIIKDLGYLLGFADGISKALKENNQ